MSFPAYTNATNVRLDVWNKNNIKEPIRSGDNPIPPLDDLAKLEEVYAIYRSHFTGSVIYGRNFEKQMEAITSANREIKNKGLDKLLVNPDSIDAGIQ